MARAVSRTAHRSVRSAVPACRPPSARPLFDRIGFGAAVRPRVPTHSIVAVHSKQPLPRLGASSLSGCEINRMRDYADAPAAAIDAASKPHTGHPALPRRGAYGRSRTLRLRRPRCCSSSVVEHSLGKGEVESSILSCSTINARLLREIDCSRETAVSHPSFTRGERPFRTAAAVRPPPDRFGRHEGSGGLRDNAGQSWAKGLTRLAYRRPLWATTCRASTLVISMGCQTESGQKGSVGCPPTIRPSRSRAAYTNFRRVKSRNL